MEEFNTVLLIILSVFVVVFIPIILGKISAVKKEVLRLRTDITVRRKEVQKTHTETLKKEQQVLPPLPDKKETVKEKPVVKEEPVLSEVQAKAKPPVFKEKIQQAVVKEVVTSKVKAEPKKRKEKGSFDLENFIGIKLISKIAIVILVLGLAFFVKYAIDKHWINEIGRVAIGVISGGILLGFAHWLRKKYRAFSSVLAGGGVAVQYITIAIAFQEYAIFSQTAAFIIMIVITAFAVVLSITYGRQEIAVLAILGGFATPFMVSTGEGNYIVLFTYLLILNIGMLALAFFKRWYLINIISYSMTILLYGAWLVSKVLISEGSPPYTGALIFASLFYITFFLMNIVNNITKSRKLGFFEVFMLLTNSGLYYLAGMWILHYINDGIYQGLYTAIIAVFNFIFAIALYKSKKVDNNLVYMLIGMVLTFVSLVAPAQLEGSYITLFWAAEAVLVLWLAQQTGMKIIKLASVIITFVMFGSLIIDWAKIYIDYGGEEYLSIIFNKGFLTSMAALTSVILTFIMLRKEDSAHFVWGFSPKIYKAILIPFFIVFLYVSFLIELNYQLTHYIEFSASRELIIAGYNLLFIFGLILWSGLHKSKLLRGGMVILGLISGFFYILIFHEMAIDVRTGFLDPLFFDRFYFLDDAPVSNDVTPFHYYFHYFNAALILAISAITCLNLKKINGLPEILFKIAVWQGVLILLFVLTSELDHIVVLSNYGQGSELSEIIKQSRKIGWPILWGLSFFVLMVIGMKKKLRDIRILSLAILFVILLKLFVYDIRDINEAGKIAAFISLGVLLLVISFMYQKLKWVVLDEPEGSNEAIPDMSNTGGEKDEARSDKE